MEIGVAGFDGIPGSGDGFGSVSVDSARSECLKQERSGFYGDSWRASKMAKTVADDFSLGVGTFPFKSTSTNIDATLPYFDHMEASQCRNSGYYSSGGLDTSSGVYLLSGVRGPFTPSQWIELEQQALIYKYIISNVPIPVHLLIPIRRAFESAGFYGLNGATLKSNSWGWGPFHLGYSNSTDPEPGRCRRTDGKKWRCARDAVVNQKYCEKHMNRGRHRSRKHVEGQGNGPSVSGGATNKSSTTKPIPPTTAGGSSNNFDINSNVNTSLNRMIVNRENSAQALQDATELSYLSQGMNLNRNGISFSISKHQTCNQEPSLNGFGTPSSELLLDVASQKHYGSYISESRNSICTYMDDEWPKSNGGADRLSTQYSGLQSQSGSTQLSMSIPMGPADFMSSTSSPINDKAVVSPLRLFQEHEMGLGFGSQFQSPEQANWKPISWEASMGGPLAEALQSSSTSNNTDESGKSSALSLLPGSCQLSSSSPTGVLQKSTLVSLSNSSAGSSPRADNSKTIESGGSLCTDLLGSATLAIASSLPDST